MAEDGIPEILAEQRLGHGVPGMRGLYAHASDRMRADLPTSQKAPPATHGWGFQKQHLSWSDTMIWEWS